MNDKENIEILTDRLDLMVINNQQLKAKLDKIKKLVEHSTDKEPLGFSLEELKDILK